MILKESNEYEHDDDCIRNKIVLPLSNKKQLSYN